MVGIVIAVMAADSEAAADFGNVGYVAHGLPQCRQINERQDKDTEQAPVGVQPFLPVPDIEPVAGGGTRKIDRNATPPRGLVGDIQGKFQRCELAGLLFGRIKGKADDIDEEYTTLAGFGYGEFGKYGIDLGDGQAIPVIGHRVFQKKLHRLHIQGRRDLVEGCVSHDPVTGKYAAMQVTGLIQPHHWRADDLHTAA